MIRTKDPTKRNLSPSNDGSSEHNVKKYKQKTINKCDSIKLANKFEPLAKKMKGPKKKNEDHEEMEGLAASNSTYDPDDYFQDGVVSEDEIESAPMEEEPSTQELEYAPTPSLQQKNPNEERKSTDDQTTNTEILTTILIYPDEKDTQEFFANNTKTYRLLVKSPLGKCEIVENTRNIRKNVQVVKIKKTDQRLLNDVLQMTRLGNYDITCRLARERNQDTPQRKYRIGVIGPIGLDTPLDELKELIEEKGHQVYKVERLLRSRKFNNEPTNKIKIWFESETLPEYITLMLEKFRINPFIQRAYQCYKCQSFGHHANQCTNKTKCIVCAEEHRLADCPNKNKNDRLKCANCGEAHTANYSECSFIVKENKIQKIKAHEGLSYSEALKKIQNNPRNYNNPETTSTINLSASTSHRPREEHRNSYLQATKRTTFEETHPPTPPTPTISSKFIIFMYKIIKEMTTEKPTSEKFSSLQNLVSEFYESDLDLKELEQFMEQNES